MSFTITLNVDAQVPSVAWGIAAQYCEMRSAKESAAVKTVVASIEENGAERKR